jgi:heme exporter protein C
MFKFLINPSRFNKFANNIFKPLIVITLLFIIVGLILVYLSPLDYQQGLTVKIMYIHVPSAWLALLIYAVMTIYSILGLTFKIPFSFIINKAIAPIGAVFTLLCLISGSMWGKPMWGTWWVWDARLTSVAILFAIYLVIIFLNQTFENREVKEKTVAIFILIGSIGSIIVLLFSIPVIIFSVGINKVDSNFNSLINLLFGIALIFLGISPWSSAACIKLALKNK